MENNNFIVPLNGLAVAGERFSWSAGKEFFELFGNSEVSNASLEIDCSVAKVNGKISINCRIDGRITVPCDRCLEDLEIPLGVSFDFFIKFGEGEEVEDEGREVVFVAETDTDYDMSQIIYDYVCISLPMQRVHPEGECNPETVRHMNSEVSDSEPNEADLTQNPFASLKGLF